MEKVFPIFLLIPPSPLFCFISTPSSSLSKRLDKSPKFSIYLKVSHEFSDELGKRYITKRVLGAQKREGKPALKSAIKAKHSSTNIYTIWLRKSKYETIFYTLSSSLYNFRLKLFKLSESIVFRSLPHILCTFVFRVITARILFRRSSDLFSYTFSKVTENVRTLRF